MEWAFQQCGILTSVDSDEPVQPPFKFRNSKWFSVSSLTLIVTQVTSKGSDQTARMRSFIGGLAGRTYHIVMSRLICNILTVGIHLSSSPWFASKETADSVLFKLLTRTYGRVQQFSRPLCLSSILLSVVWGEVTNSHAAQWQLLLNLNHLEKRTIQKPQVISHKSQVTCQNSKVKGYYCVSRL